MNYFLPRFFQERRLEIKLASEFQDFLNSEASGIEVPIDVEFGAVLKIRRKGRTFCAWIDRRPFRRWKSPIFCGSVLHSGDGIVFNGVFKMSKFETIGYSIFGIFSILALVSIFFGLNQIEEPSLNMIMISGLLLIVYVYLSYTFERDFERIRTAFGELSTGSGRFEVTTIPQRRVGAKTPE